MSDEKDAIMAINEATDMSDLEKKDKTRDISQRIYKKIMPLLSKEQGEKYTKMEEAKKF